MSSKDKMQKRIEKPLAVTRRGRHWVPDAIAQQEEYLRRIRPCSGDPDKTDPVVGRPHEWDHFSLAPGTAVYEACFWCRVTRTDEDYQREHTSEDAMNNKEKMGERVEKLLAMAEASNTGGKHQ